MAANIASALPLIDSGVLSPTASVRSRSSEEAPVVAATESKAASLFAEIQQFFVRMRQNAQYGYFARFTPIASSAGRGAVYASQVFNHIVLAFPNTFINTPMSESTKEWLGKGRLAGISVGAPVALYNIISEAIEIYTQAKKGRLPEGVDAALRLTEQIAALGDTVASFANGLSIGGMVESSAVLWATPLGIVSAALGGISIAINARRIYASNQILGKLDGYKPLDYLKEELENFDKDGDFFLDRNFGIINREKYAAQILHIINFDPSNVDEKAIPIRKHHSCKREMLNALKGRLQEKITNHKVAILGAIVGLLGVMILFFPVLGPAILGFTLLCLAAAIALYRYAKEVSSIHRLENTLDALCDFNQIPYETLPAAGQSLRNYLNSL